MKVKCPQCGIKGYLQLRGKSARVGHYKGYSGKTRIIEWHKADYDTISLMVNNGNQKVANNKAELGFKSESMRGCRLAWSRLGDLGSLDPGSNPGSPITRPELN